MARMTNFTPVDYEFTYSIIYFYRDLKTEEDSEESQAENGILQQLLSILDLPPSLQPPPPGGWKISMNTEWGWVTFALRVQMTVKPIPNINKRRNSSENQYYFSFLRIFNMKGRFHLLFVAVFRLNNKFTSLRWVKYLHIFQNKIWDEQ